MDDFRTWFVKDLFHFAGIEVTGRKVAAALRGLRRLKASCADPRDLCVVCNLSSRQKRRERPSRVVVDNAYVKGHRLRLCGWHGSKAVIVAGRSAPDVQL